MIRLRRGNIIVRLLAPSAVKVGGIELIRVEKDKRWQEEQIEAEVTHVGPWVEGVKVGDKIVMAGHEGKWMDRGLVDEDGTYRLCKEGDILGVLESVVLESAV